MSNLTAALSIKLMKVLYVSWVWHWFSLLYSQADTSGSAHMGYPEGTFPAREKLVHALLVKHKPLVVAPERLSVACIFNSILSSSLIDQVDILTSELVLRGFVICLDT
jgi:hypothetical protein